MDDREIICDAYISTEIDLDWYWRDSYINRQVRAILRWRISIESSFENFKKLIKKKNLFMDDREIIWDDYITTEIDLY